MGTNSNTRDGLRAHLAIAREQADLGAYEQALESIHSAKSENPRNVYLLALEKQVEQLSRLHHDGRLDDESRTDILESIPEIIERALNGATEIAAGTTVITKPLNEVALRQREEKTAALEWLKNQYFQHAHEYVQKGQYDHALAEIRRVFIIDPPNQIAKDFETQILQLIELRSRAAKHLEEPAAPVEVPHAAPAAEVHSPAPIRPPARKHEKTAEVGHAADAPQLPAEWLVPHKEKPKKKLSGIVMVAIFLTIAIIGAAVFYYIIRAHKAEKIKSRGNAPLAGNFAFSPSSNLIEQNFVISHNPAEQISQTPAENSENSEKVDTKTVVPTTPLTEQQQADTGNSSPQPVGTLQEHASSNVADLKVAGSPVPVTLSDPVPQGEPPDSKNEEAKPETFVAVQQPAQLLKLEKPKFSDIAYQTGLAGQLVIQVQIDAEGKPQTAKILRSTNSLLDDAMLDAVLNSTFLPARMTSGPVSSSLIIPFNFKR